MVISPEIKKYFSTNTQKEIHMVGDYVGVCWNMKKVKETNIDEIGNPIKITRFIREDVPYIGFPCLREDGEGGYYERDNSTVDYGLNPVRAEEVLKELQWACDYIKEVQ